VLVATAGAAAALIPALWLYGFTVDDALIPARYAAHLARGLGYRFNAAGPITDGVTPLGFPYLIAPFAAGGPLAALAAAKAMGVAAWTLAAAVLGLAVRRLGTSPLRYGALVLLLGSAPLAAWSAAGLETGIAAALAALAVALPELGLARAGAAAAGMTAAFRPETLPWALVVAAAPPPAALSSDDGGSAGLRAPASWKPPLCRLVLAAAPFLAVAAARVAIFGKVVPLSVLAKPSDLAHGGPYALACFVFTGPVVILAPLAFLRQGGRGRWLCLAVVVHFAAIAAAGGDWMPLSRLAVPALPTAFLAAARLAEVASPLATVLRLVLALAGQALQIVQVGPAKVAGVGAARRELIEAVAPSLAGAAVVAGLDVGWLGAATDATVVDLAGLTDPAIAALSGGHTSKAIPARLFDARGVDAIVLLLLDGRPLADPWTDSYFGRAVELRVSEFPGIGETFSVALVSQVPHLRYVVLRRRP
jgi:hypothetical protein